MQTSLRKIGNSTGMILPKDVLRQIGAGVGAAMDVVVEGRRVIATPIDVPHRRDWAQAAAEIVARSDPETQDWTGFANEGDVAFEW